MDTYTFHIAGVKHHQLQDVIDQLSTGDFLNLTLEPSNPYDSFAVRIEYVNNEGNETMLGYVPQKFSQDISEAITKGTKLNCQIENLDPEAKPWKQCFVSISESKEVTQDGY